MTVRISFSELNHPDHSCNMVPLGVAMVAARAVQEFGDTIDADLFKEVRDYLPYLEKATPNIACFSIYVWNTELSCEIARRIKLNNPESITVFGGPNYPLLESEQEQFLRDHPYIDFYINREGEEPFVELVAELLKNNLDVEKTKESSSIPNCHYLFQDKAVLNAVRRPNDDLNALPSPYQLGLCDGFLEQGLVPIVQSARGCPFTCTFCQEGESFFNKVRRFDLERVVGDCQYISERTTAPNLIFADSNFGMYKQDLALAHELSSIQKRCDWPKKVFSIEGKNNKERVTEVAFLINGHLSAAVQSTSANVLDSVKRKDIGTGDLIKVAKSGEQMGLSSFSELILCLPGDSKESHMASFYELMDAGIKTIRSHQFILLPGASASSAHDRKKFEMQTRYRIVPQTISSYRLFDEEFTAPEIDEICIANNSMSFEDYLECRMFTLTVEIFYNDNIFGELIKLLVHTDVKVSDFISKVHETIRASDGPLAGVYENFVKESKELWNTYDDAKADMQKPEVLERITRGELCFNEQLVFRAVALTQHMDELQTIAFGVAEKLLNQRKDLMGKYETYLKDLAAFTLLKKQNILDCNAAYKGKFSFDLKGLEQADFNDDPLAYNGVREVDIEFRHSEEQKNTISKYVDLYGDTDYGLGTIISSMAHFPSFFRETHYG